MDFQEVSIGPRIARRNAIATCAAGVVLAATGRKASAAPNVIDVTSPPYNASPNLPDNTPSFQSALNTLRTLGGGVLIVPPGAYALRGPLEFAAPNGSLTVSGYGSELSVLLIKHSGTALDVMFTNAGDSQSLTVKDIGFSPAPGSGAAGTAVALKLQNVGSAWPSCRFENVDFGVQSPNYTVFTTALKLTNVWRSTIVACTSHSNAGIGATFLSLNGMCIDNRVQGCNIDGYQTGIYVGNYSEGLHIVDTVFIGGTALSTGSADYNKGINLLGLYISGCELNCQNTVLSLFQVNSGWVSDSDLSGPRSTGGSIACAMVGCHRLKIANCLFEGSLNTAAPSNQIGVGTFSSPSQATTAITVDDCDFENTLVALELGAGTENFTSLGIRMLAPGNAALVNAPVVYGTYAQQPLVDNSASTSNTVQWLATSSASGKTASRRTIYSR